MHDCIAERLKAASAALDQEQVPLQRLADAHGQATHGALMILLAVPCVLPVPGVGSVLGWGLLALAIAMWRGSEALCLPQKVADVALPLSWARRVLEVLARFYALAGRCSRPRWLHWTGARAMPLVAACAALMAVLIILPIPFGNVLPAVSLALLGVGLSLRDGIAVLAGAIAAKMAVLFVAGLAWMAWLGGDAGLAWLGL